MQQQFACFARRSNACIQFFLQQKSQEIPLNNRKNKCSLTTHDPPSSRLHLAKITSGNTLPTTFFSLQTSQEISINSVTMQSLVSRNWSFFVLKNHANHKLVSLNNVASNCRKQNQRLDKAIYPGILQAVYTVKKDDQHLALGNSLPCPRYPFILEQIY